MRGALRAYTNCELALAKMARAMPETFVLNVAPTARDKMDRNIAALLLCRKTPTKTARVEKWVPRAVHNTRAEAGQLDNDNSTGQTSPGRRKIAASQHCG